MIIKKYNINDLKPSEYNPRKISLQEKQDIESSLDEFGLVEPLVVNEYKGREGVIVGGHQRYFILKEKGFKVSGVEQGKKRKLINWYLTK